MSLPILPAVLSALFLAGSAGAAVTSVRTNDAPAKARSDRAGKPEAKRSKALGLCAQIECTAEQKEKIQELRAAAKADRKADHEAMKALRKELAAEYRKDRLDTKAMGSIHARMDKVSDERVDDRRDMLTKAHGVLTPEQRDAIADRIEKRGEGRVMSGRGERDGKGKTKGKADSKGKADGKAKAKAKKVNAPTK